MSPNTILLFFLILLCVLAGIALGTHIAFSSAEIQHHTKPRKYKYVDVSPEQPQSKCDWVHTDKNTNTTNTLNDRIHSQESESLAVFTSHLNGQNAAPSLEKNRKHQDKSYCYLYARKTNCNTHLDEIEKSEPQNCAITNDDAYEEILNVTNQSANAETEGETVASECDSVEPLTAEMESNDLIDAAPPHARDLSRD